MDRDTGETRPPATHASRRYHWLQSGRAEGRPSSDDVSVCEWLHGCWQCAGETSPVVAHEMHRRGWRYYKPVEWPAGLDDEPEPIEAATPSPTPTAQRVVEAAVAERRAYLAVRDVLKQTGHVGGLSLHETWKAAHEEYQAATDAHLASLKSADPLVVALGHVRALIEAPLSLTPRAGMMELQDRARAAIPLIEAAMKGEG